MASRVPRMPRSTSSVKIKRAVTRLKNMPMEDRIQLMVKARLMTQEEADQAKRNLAEAEAEGTAR